MTAGSLVGLLDFGRADNGLSGEAPFSVSPDGRWAAMAVRRADAGRDLYCIGILLVALDRRSPPRLLDVGGAFIAMTHDVRDAPDIVNGSPDPGTPRWSPDGRWIAFLRRDGGRTGLWVVGLDGRPARHASHFATDVIGFGWSPDGRRLLARTRPGLIAARAAIEREGRSGYLFDRRFWTLSDDRPRPPLPIPVVTIAIDPATGTQLAPSAVTASGAPAAPGALLDARMAGGALAWTALRNPAQPFGPTGLHVRYKGRDLACPAAICEAAVGGLWWSGPADLLVMTAANPANGGRLALYRWPVASPSAPVRLLDTIDALFGCQLARGTLICAREQAAHPRTIVSVDPRTGAIATLFDPNPDFAARRTGGVERLVWSRDGVTTYGDLVLPPDHRPGDRHPLVVVQYTSRGFLRGGTGDEVPIQLLAAHGFAVLSFQRPAMLPAAARAHDLAGVQRINIAGLAERRMIFAALDAGVDAAIATGTVDPARIGITGLSDGAVTTQFALLHSQRFEAAAIGSCCDDPSGMIVSGLSYRDALLAWGYPPSGAAATAFWGSYSLAAGAARMKTPLLIQVPDGEYRLALEAYSALQLHHAPVEMYVYPDEHHVKWHPAHRLAAYRRYVAWFDFWLRGRVPDDPRARAEARRWQAMRLSARP